MRSNNMHCFIAVKWEIGQNDGRGKQQDEGVRASVKGASYVFDGSAGSARRTSA